MVACRQASGRHSYLQMSSQVNWQIEIPPLTHSIVAWISSYLIKWKLALLVRNRVAIIICQAIITSY